MKMVELSVIQLLAVIIIPNLGLLLSFVIYTRVSFTEIKGDISLLKGNIEGLNKKVDGKDNDHKSDVAELKRIHEREIQDVRTQMFNITQKLDHMQESFNKTLMELSGKIGSAVTALEMTNRQQKG